MKGFFSSAEAKVGEGSVESKIAACGKCGLSHKCRSPKMQATGRGTRKILFVAEAPGEQEDAEGVQLIGDAGQRLRKSLRTIGVDLEDCRKTNAVICRPPKNVIEDYMITCCRPNLRKAIKLFHPQVIIALGASALSSLLKGEWRKDQGPLNRWVGCCIPSPTHNAWVCPTYHPSYILRMGEDQTLIRIWEEHLRRAVALEHKEVQFVTAEGLRDQIEVILDPREGRLRMKDLATKEGVVAFDYETTGLKPDAAKQQIVSVSFCLDGKDTFATLVEEKSFPALSQVLLAKKLKKVASNLKFEERWTRAKLGHGVRGWMWDTMLAAHVLDNRSGITSIKFQAYSQLGIADYDSYISAYLASDNGEGINNIRKLDPRDLLLYNGMDSLLEYKIMKKQRRILYNGNGHE